MLNKDISRYVCTLSSENSCSDFSFLAPYLWTAGVDTLLNLRKRLNLVRDTPTSFDVNCNMCFYELKQTGDNRKLCNSYDVMKHLLDQSKLCKVPRHTIFIQEELNNIVSV